MYYHIVYKEKATLNSNYPLFYEAFILVILTIKIILFENKSQRFMFSHDNA